MEYMYLAHINFPFAGAERLRTTVPFDPKHVDIRNEIFPGLAASPESLKRIDQTAAYEPELVAIVNAGESAGGTVGSVMAYGDGTAFWVSQGSRELDHYVIWITHSADRGACGFQLPSTAGPRGFEAEKALGNIKRLSPGETVTMRYACGFCDAQDDVPIESAR
jgi:hypothetical protein